MTPLIFRKGKGKAWHFRFQIAGIRMQRSTREISKGRAEEVARRTYDDAVLASNGGKPVPTLAQLVKQWQDVNMPVVSDAHARSIEVFNRLHLYDLANMPVTLITTEVVEATRNLHLRTHSPASANHWMRILKLVVNWAVKRGIIMRLPWSVKMLKVQKRPRPILPLQIALAWFEAVDSVTRHAPTVATAIRLMFGLGLRASESAGAKWEWIDWERRTYTPGETKGREAEPIPIAPWLIEHLQPIRRFDGLIAPGAGGERHPDGFARRPMRAANSICKTKGITPHRLRGSFATLLSENGVPVHIIQEVMRHKSVLTTIGYLEKNRDTVSAAQIDIASKIGFQRRESGAPHETNPTNDSTS